MARDATLAPAVPPSTPVASAPSPAPSAPLRAVRLGRLPPRTEAPALTEARARARASGLAPIDVKPTLPRRAFPHEKWKEVEALAARLDVPVDTAFRKVVRALVEGTAAISTALRGTGHVVAALIASSLLPQTACVVGPDLATLGALRDQLERGRIPCLLLDGPRGAEPNPGELARIASGGVKVVLGTPSTFGSDAVLGALGSAGVSLVTVLEAQDSSTWSRTFSPAAARVRTHLDRLGGPPVFAIAPGAGSAVQGDVAEALLSAPPTMLDGPLVRPNVTLRFRGGRGDVRQRAFVEAVRALPRPMLVLANTPRDVDAAHAALRALGLPVHRYHEELRTGVRAAEQLQFSMPGDRPLLVATSAFAVGTGRDEDAEGVPLRYGRRTEKRDIRSMVRFQPPSSLEQLVDELSLLGRDGTLSEAIVFCEPSDRPALEAELESARPSGEQLLLVGRALETALDQSTTVTTESLAFAARTSHRTVQSLATVLHQMGLVRNRDGWLTRGAPSHVVSRELRALAERYATVRALDARRLDALSELASHRGCAVEKLRKLLGDASATPCGACPACKGTPDAATEPLGFAPGRQAPARRFTVSAAGTVAEMSANTFHSDRRTAEAAPLTAKLADFRS